MDGVCGLVPHRRRELINKVKHRCVYSQECPSRMLRGSAETSFLAFKRNTA